MKSLLLLIPLLTSCATTSLNRSAIYTGSAAVAGAAGGYAFSPNQESRGLNTIFWGAIAGAFGFLLERAYGPKHEGEASPSNLESRELFGRTAQDYVLKDTGQKLPEYVKRRLSPVVIEEYKERDTVGDDGGLHEPHRVWRIKQQPELTPLPQGARPP